MPELTAEAREWFGMSQDGRDSVAFAGWAEDVVDAVRAAAPGDCQGCCLCQGWEPKRRH